MNRLNFILSVIMSAGFIVHSSGQAVFNFTQDEYDFGVVNEGENLTCVFEFINGGKDTIHLKDENRDVRPGCSCTVSEFTKTPVPPGGKGIVKAGYNTQGRIGAFEKNITVSQKGVPCKILTIKGVVIKKTEESPAVNAPKKVPVLAINQKDHYFGQVEKGQKVIWRFNISNTGKDTLKILNSFSACKCTEYRLLNQKDNSEIRYILPGKSALLEVSYNPVVPAALSDKKTLDILTLFTNDPAIKRLPIKLTADIIL
jgi:hypothetical protein